MSTHCVHAEQTEIPCFSSAIFLAIFSWTNSTLIRAETINDWCQFHTARSKLASRSNFQEISGNRDDVSSEQYVNRILLYKISTISYVHIVFYLIDIFQLFPLYPCLLFVLSQAHCKKGVDKNRSS